MATEDQSANGSWTVRWAGQGVEKTAEGTYRIPVVLEGELQQVAAYLDLDPNGAGTIHAQLHRLLTAGWAMTDAAKVARQQGEIYPVGGSSRLA
jgi:hypothetical protein